MTGISDTAIEEMTAYETRQLDEHNEYRDPSWDDRNSFVPLRRATLDVNI